MRFPEGKALCAVASIFRVGPSLAPCLDTFPLNHSNPLA